MLDKVLFKRSFQFVLVTLLFLASPVAASKKSAGLAMFLCVFPGGGQFYTERYVPGIVIGSGEIALGYYAYRYHTQERYSERNSLLWWNLFLFGYSLADAYVGAKMYGFDIETDINKVGLKFSLKW